MPTITLTTFDGATPVTETLPQTTLADAVEATLARARTEWPEAFVQHMWPDGADLWGCKSRDYQCFGTGYYLNVKAD